MRALAGAIFSDTWRRRGSWTTTLLTGLLFTVLVVGSGSVSERVQARAESISFSIAVDGDTAGGAHLLEQLRTDRLNGHVVDNAANDVTNSQASAGVRLPEQVDERLARGEPVELTMFYRAGQNTSREAYNNVLIRLQEIEAGRLQVRSFETAPTVEVEERQVARDERVNRLQFSRTLAALAAVLGLGVVSSVASVLGRSRDRRSLEPMLLLPLRRSAVATGIALGALPVAILQLVAAVAALVLVSAMPVLGLSLSWPTILEILVVAVLAATLLGTLACCVGCAAGAIGTGSDDAVSMGDFFALPFVVVGALLFLQPAFGSGPLAFVAPILGPALVLREGGSGTLELWQAALAVLSTAGWCWLLLRWAGRLLGNEKAITRATR